MADPVQSRLATFRQLERLIKQGDRLELAALQRAEIAAADYAAVVSQYRDWYAACLALLPEDLQPAFRDAYDDIPFQPKLETYLAHARDPNPTPRPEQRSAAWSPWKYPFNYAFQQLVSDQRKALFTFRERLLDILSAVPGELKDLVATIFGGRDHSVLAVDSLFTQAGARREWWVRPVAVSGRKRDRVRGWFAGILIHAPDRERAIVEAVCRSIIRHGLAGQAAATHLQNLLEKLAPGEPTAPPPDAHLYIAPERLDALRQIADPPFDLARLLRLCEELNMAIKQRMFIAAALLTRALIDHVPPIFGAASFKELVATRRAGPFKDAMQQLDDALRQIAGAYLHGPIRLRESLPTWQQVNVGPLLDALLAEIARVLNAGEDSQPGRLRGG